MKGRGSLMKKLILISGTMGIGKSTITEELSQQTKQSVYLDGDWCWMMNPFVVNEENKDMVINNIHFLLNSFINNSMINVIYFCWVMDEQKIVDRVLNGIALEDIDVQHFSLIASPEKLQKNFEGDITTGKRTLSDLQRSLDRLPKYTELRSRKFDISHHSVAETVSKITKKILASS
ncbi:AAA family ATPase [Enterococcus casseliflavus]|nr:AAA family ATPase [Enterococcus casseliflavus]